MQSRRQKSSSAKRGEPLELSREQERLLKDGGYGERKAMELLIALGDVYDASKLIPVTSAHISGASYKTIGDPGLRFLSEICEGCRAKVRSTVNPIGMDRERFHEMRVSEGFVAKQKEIIGYYESLGVLDSWTCTPYLIGNRPGLGEHIAWAESSAVVFANSVLGARTNREGGPSALASSITGLTPDYGLHKEENRKADVLFELEFDLEEREFAPLGSFAGEICGTRMPYFRKLSAAEDDLKTLSASLASSGSVSMFHVEGLTPEWELGLKEECESVSVEREDLEEIADGWNKEDEPDLVAFGCPHCSTAELGKLADMLKDGWKGPELWVCTSRAVCENIPETVQLINKHGKLLCDTCVIVSSVEDFSSMIATNSGKASTYLPTLCKQKTMFADAETLVRRFQ
ncbi:MAG: aconitase X catalytic domain-containing protein [Thermoplasmata archaeon]